MSVKRYTATICCRECGMILATVNDLTEEDRGAMHITAAREHVDACPNGCRPTFIDLNINTTIEWKEQPDV